MVLKGLLMHVAADSTNLGISGPLFEDGTFKYIPLGPEDDDDSSEKLTYNLLGLSPYIPMEYDDLRPHYDPNPLYFTYGEPPGGRRGKQVLKFRAGDYFFPVASLAPIEKGTYSVRTRRAISQQQYRKMAKYVIGWYKISGVFRVDKAHDKNRIKSTYGMDSVPRNIVEQISQNAHFKRSSDEFVCAIGEREDRETCLLKTAIQLTRPGAPFLPNELGLTLYGDVAFPRGWKWLEEDKVRLLSSEIRKH